MSPDGPGGTAPEGPAGRHEYRAAELARAAGITPRTLRFYRERRLLPPPRREGRIAWYDEHHLARLHTITTLLQRGHTLGGIAELIAAFEKGKVDHTTAGHLGVDELLTGSFSEETPVRLTPEDMADYFQNDITPEDLAESLDLGYMTVDGDEVVHISRRLLEASAELVREGIPLSAVLGAGRALRGEVDVIAEVFSDLLRSYVLPGKLSPADADRINATMERLRPVARQVVDAELGLALDRRVRAELAAWVEEPAPAATGHGDGAPSTPGDTPAPGSGPGPGTRPRPDIGDRG